MNSRNKISCFYKHTRKVIKIVKYYYTKRTVDSAQQLHTRSDQNTCINDCSFSDNGVFQSNENYHRRQCARHNLLTMQMTKPCLKS